MSPDTYLILLIILAVFLVAGCLYAFLKFVQFCVSPPKRVRKPRSKFCIDGVHEKCDNPLVTKHCTCYCHLKEV